jgi:heme/copper-type cytochrome/quinol oxidase subunit 2
LVMNFDRYLATYYPIFHRTSVTKGKLLTLLAIPSIVMLTFRVMSVNSYVISNPVFGLIFFFILFPPLLFINYKLFTFVRKCRKSNGMSPEMKKTFSFKSISSCLLTVACYVVLSIPVFVYIGLKITSKKETTTMCDNVLLARLWASTIPAMNSTFNCLIFFWKNNILCNEGMKVIKNMKICRRIRSQSDH